MATESKKKIRTSMSDPLVMHYASWCLVGLVMLIVMLRNSDMLKLFLGDSIVIIFITAAVLCAASPFFLMFVKNKRIRYSIMFCITAIFFVSFVGLRIGAGAFISDFTTERWQEYPKYRNKMIDDLKENHGIIGMNAMEVEELLGEPDLKSEIIFSYFMDREDRAFMYIEVIFQDGGVKSIEFIYNI